MGNHFARFSRVIAFWVAGVATSLSAAEPPEYHPPDLTTPIYNAAQLKTDIAVRKQAAGALADYAVSGLKYDRPEDYRRASHLLGIALRLDPANRAAVITNGTLQRNLKPSASTAFEPRAVIDQLPVLAAKFKAAGTPADKTVAAYLYDIVADINPADQDAIYEYEILKQDGVKVDWSFADGKAAANKATASQVAADGNKAVRNTAQPANESIAIPAFRDKPKPFALAQASVKGLMVRQSDHGYLGFANDIILTVTDRAPQVATAPPAKGGGKDVGKGGGKGAGKGGGKGGGKGAGKGERPQDKAPATPPIDIAGIYFARPVGQQMLISCQEAARAIRVRYPRWSGGFALISFEDKYTPVDGGSAGTAFSVMLLSALEGFQIDKTFAVTGDVTVDWKVRKIGGVGAKVHGATADGCKGVAIPAENAAQLDDVLVLEGEKPFWDIQIYSITTLHDAVRILRADRDPATAEAIALFAQLQQEHAEFSRVYRKPAGIAKLKKVLELAPNHLSARYLLTIASGKVPSRLTATGSMYEAIMAVADFRDLLRGYYTPDSPRITLESVRDARTKLRRLRGIANQDIIPFINALQAFVEACGEVACARPPLGNDPVVQQRWLNQVLGYLRQRRDNVLSTLQKLEGNQQLMEKMWREGV